MEVVKVVKVKVVKLLKITRHPSFNWIADSHWFYKSVEKLQIVTYNWKLILNENATLKKYWSPTFSSYDLNSKNK